MSSGALVDLLIVRLSRDEEKEKVRELLVSHLDMSPEEAAQAVETTPAMLPQPLPMDQARKLQEKMYPYIDVLPRQYSTESPPSQTTDPKRDGLDKEGLFDGPDREIDISDEDFTHGYSDSSGSVPVSDEDEITIVGSPSEVDDDDAFVITTPSEVDDDDTFVITTPSEDLKSIERCHVCGRTPVDTEKLAPCRTCGELTCGDCFDRIVHVCGKCASEGRVVDRPLKGTPEYKRREEEEEEEEIPVPEERKPTRSGGITRVSVRLPLIIIGLLVIAGAAFYLLDPLDMFGPEEGQTPVFGPASVDTSTVAAPADTLRDDTLGSTSSDSVAAYGADSLTAPADSLVQSSGQDSLSMGTAGPDSLPADSSAGPLPDSLQGSLRNVVLPEGVKRPEEMVWPNLIFRSGISGVEVLSDSLGHLSYPIGCVSLEHGIEADGISLIRTETGTDVLIISILHPEPLEERTAFISSLGSMLDSTSVDQIVMYYSQSEYHPHEIFTFVSESFGSLGGSSSPSYILDRQGFVESSWMLLSGPVRDWMLGLD